MNRAVRGQVPLVAGRSALRQRHAPVQRGCARIIARVRPEDKIQSSDEMEAEVEEFMKAQAEIELGSSGRTQLENVVGADLVDDEQARDLCRRVLAVLRTLQDRRDFTPNEMRLILLIEDPRARDRRNMGIEDDTGVSREEIASAFLDVVDGKIPNDRIALKVLAEEVENWPFLEAEGASAPQQPQEGEDTAARGAWIEGQARPPMGRDKNEKAESIEDLLPDWVGYGAVWGLSLIPVFITISVVALLFFSSLR
ncbi:unnamed protein product [Pedinophyceae sp. YPF-701]|nr:unnamed protein product [Pedinophyceae sp. YPF-701]